MISTLQFGSLSPTITLKKYPVETVQVTQPFPAVPYKQIKEALPLYDNNSDLLLQGILLGVTAKIERLIDLDTTKRERVSVWDSPAPIICLPFGPHEDLVIEQYEHGHWKVATDVEIMGIAKKRVKLQYLYPTRISYTSGHEDVPDLIQAAIVQEVSFQYKNRNDPDEVQPDTKHGLSIPTVNLLDGYMT